MKKDKKMVSGFTPELEQAIREDIEKGQKALVDNSPSTHKLYREIQSKYLQLYPHLCDGIVSRVKLRKNIDDYSKELSEIISALQGILLGKIEPYQQNAGQIINNGTIKIKGSNVGYDNELTKQTSVEAKLEIPLKSKK